MATKFHDRSEIRKAIVLDNGFLKAPATLARVGVYHYAPAGQKPFSVMRRAEDVFAIDSVASFELVPLVNDHPVENDGVVNKDNAKRLTVGSLGSVTRNGEHLDGTIMVTDAGAIESIRAGKVQISLGYFADLQEAPAGSSHNGEAFQFYQTNIRGNHCALVDRARAGESARLHLDAGDCVEIEPTSNPKERTTVLKINLDGIPCEVSEVAHAAILKERVAGAAILAAAESAAAKAKITADTAEGQRDAAKLEAKTLSEKIAKLEDPKHLAGLIAERVAVEKIAAEHSITADGLSLADVKRAVIAKQNPAIKLDGKSNDYVEAMFDALNVLPKTNAVTAAAAVLVKDDAKPVAKSGDVAKDYRAAFFAVDALADRSAK